MADIQLYSAFEPGKVQFGTLEKNKKGSKMVLLGYPGKRRICIQTPTVSLPFGINKPYQEGGDIQSHSLDISFKGYDSNPAIATFLSKMEQLDDILLNHAVQESPTWFGKPLSRDIVQEFFRPLVRAPKDPNYAATMKIKIPVLNGHPNCVFFDEERNQVPMETITKGTTARFLVELSGVWFVNKHFGLSWRLVQCAIASRPSRIDGFGFVEDDAEQAPLDTAAHAFVDDGAA